MGDQGKCDLAEQKNNYVHSVVKKKRNNTSQWLYCILCNIHKDFQTVSFMRKNNACYLKMLKHMEF